MRQTEMAFVLTPNPIAAAVTTIHTKEYQIISDTKLITAAVTTIPVHGSIGDMFVYLRFLLRDECSVD
jgi:hypothetical protein